jgi:hypothetical protein
MEEFDLLAGNRYTASILSTRELGEKSGITSVLLWKRIEAKGHTPSAREVVN